MLVFPNCKINLGLYVTEKRPDGFHNIETVFYPVNWCDALEVLENTASNAIPFTLHWREQKTTIPLENQLLYRAWKLVREIRTLPPIHVFFLKQLPLGAGLGGGSSDGAHMIQLLNRKFNLKLSAVEQLELAGKLGSDCPFFILNTPQYARGRGEWLNDFDLDLSAYFILLVYPGIHCDTAQAYRTIRPVKGRPSLLSILQQPNFNVWRNELVNDFEPGVFKEHPLIGDIKNQMYASGALYASLSGSGSTVFGIFSETPSVKAFGGYTTYLQEPLEKVF